MGGRDFPVDAESASWRARDEGAEPAPQSIDDILSWPRQNVAHASLGPA